MIDHTETEGGPYIETDLPFLVQGGATTTPAPSSPTSGPSGSQPSGSGPSNSGGATRLAAGLATVVMAAFIGTNLL